MRGRVVTERVRADSPLLWPRTPDERVLSQDASDSETEVRTSFESTRALIIFCASMNTLATTSGTTVLTTASPSNTDSTVIGVVIFLIVLTLAVVGILLYRYLCQNKGNYRTTGEPVPGEDMEQAAVDAAEPLDKKEYFI